jgi:hypothetical protein
VAATVRGSGDGGGRARGAREASRRHSEERHRGSGEVFFCSGEERDFPFMINNNKLAATIACIIGLINISRSPQTSMYFLFFSEMFVLLV